MIPGKIDPQATALSALGAAVEQLKADLATTRAEGARERNLLALTIEAWEERLAVRDAALEKLEAHSAERDAEISKVLALDTLHPPTEAETAARLEELAKGISRVLAPEFAVERAVHEARLNQLIERVNGIDFTLREFSEEITEQFNATTLRVGQLELKPRGKS